MIAVVWLGVLLGVGAWTTESSTPPAPEWHVIAHPRGAPTHLDQGTLASIYTSRQRYWGSGQRIITLNLPSRSVGRVAFDHAVLNRSPDEVARFWIEERMRGRDRPPRQVSSQEVLARVVARLPGSIGYVRAATAVPSGARVVARIEGGRVVRP